MNELTARRSIRIYNSNVKISKKEMTMILEDTMRAPSSMNMQPTRFFVVESDEAKAKLAPVLHGNKVQLETSAAMICLFTDLQKFEYAETIYNKAVDANLMPEEVRDRQLRNIANFADDITTAALEKTGLLDGGLIAMQLMHVARSYGYDTCPIGGFKHELLAEALGIDPKRYRPILILSIGEKAEDGYSSVRLDVDQVTTWL